MPFNGFAQLEKLAKLIRYYILVSTTAAGSGHPTSSLSAVELMTYLYFGKQLKFDLDNPASIYNDRVIFSKGHAAPLFYALYAAAGKVSLDELKTLRQFHSNLEGHPTMNFPYTEAATGSLGQGLSIGAGMALNAKYLDKVDNKTYVLLGDSEMAEGSNWEAMELAAYYKLNNLVAILDVNRLGQRGQTIQGNNVYDFAYKARAFGWKTIVINGHSFKQIDKAFKQTLSMDHRPSFIISKTIKGKGVSFLEDMNNWHGRALNEQELNVALSELGNVDLELRGTIDKPKKERLRFEPPLHFGGQAPVLHSPRWRASLSTREAFGQALLQLGENNPDVVVLDAEVSNSSKTDKFKHQFPDRFFEMFIAEQNMLSMAVGLARRGKVPFVSTFSAFLTRTFDQIRMSAYSQANIKIVGSHAGVEIGADGTSQMGLEDIAMMRSVHNSVVLYPSDGVACEKLTLAAADHEGLVYLRTTRDETPVIYSENENFVIGGSKTLHQSSSDQATIIAAGVTLHEALKAYETLKTQGILVRVIDLYSVKPVDGDTIRKAAAETGKIITAEDHYPEGGIAEAVLHCLSGNPVPVHSLAVRKMPHSGTRTELLKYEGIDTQAIVKKIVETIHFRI